MVTLTLVEHQLRRLLLHCDELDCQGLRAAWQQEYGSSLNWKKLGFSSLPKMLVAMPEACTYDSHEGIVKPVATCEAMERVANYASGQVSVASKSLEHA